MPNAKTELAPRDDALSVKRQQAHIGITALFVETQKRGAAHSKRSYRYVRANTTAARRLLKRAMRYAGREKTASKYWFCYLYLHKFIGSGVFLLRGHPAVLRLGKNQKRRSVRLNDRLHHVPDLVS